MGTIYYAPTKKQGYRESEIQDKDSGQKIYQEIILKK